MLKQYAALSIVAPNGERIAHGLKTLEIRSWLPEEFPLKNLVIVENQNYLLKDSDEEMGRAVALVDIESAHAWQQHEVEAAQASRWTEGYYAWVINNVRPFPQPIACMAKRKIYRVELM
ncbi:ASCH domain-containing protein [Acinetobacter sp. NIPH 2699]|uniref:ASCH domain-containing protein n=1 Tax=Acinetobacter sp. NIPH 2699 TaxID=2923433 RepID=UPI001F4B591E|nr:ASCH domain-containing protein [Acinetobacter sp. NIPH 2699]MCH7335559.1 ASCH domain-containing protein [Acinetobacter sp. NIPH 2699]